jgi:hypothetical protein
MAGLLILLLTFFGKDDDRSCRDDTQVKGP